MPHTPSVQEGLQWLPESVRLSPQGRHLYTYLRWRRRCFAKASAAICAGVPADEGINV